MGGQAAALERLMCPGTEFGITDMIAGVLFAFGTYVMWAVGFPWYLLIIPTISTVGWFAMAVYFFQCASKCNCKELEAQTKASNAATDAFFKKLEGK